MDNPILLALLGTSKYPSLIKTIKISFCFYLFRFVFRPEINNMTSKSTYFFELSYAEVKFNILFCPHHNLIIYNYTAEGKRSLI